MKYRIADARSPNMGLGNKICKAPKYWCRLHQVWLSEKDVERKHCQCKPTFEKKPQRLNAISAYNLLNEDRQGNNNEVIASIENLSNVLLGMSCDFASRTGRIENELSTQTGTQENILNDMVKCFANLNSKINDIGKIQVQNMEYLKQIADGIQLLNDKWK